MGSSPLAGEQRGAGALEGRLAVVHAIAAIRHPHLIVMSKVSDGAGFEPETNAGLSLFQVSRALEGFGPLSLRFGLRILLDTLSGLGALHRAEGDGQSMGFVHGGVAPGTIVVGRDGIARLIPLVPAHWGPVGEPDRHVLGYTAPEKLLGDPVDQSADIYSIGVLLWEAIMGTRLFRDLGRDAIITRLVGGKVPYPVPFSDAPWGVPLADVALRALEVEPSARWPHVGAMGAQIENLVGKHVATSSELAALVRGIAGGAPRESFSDAVTMRREPSAAELGTLRQTFPDEAATTRWQRLSSLPAVSKPAEDPEAPPPPSSPRRIVSPAIVATLPGLAGPSEGPPASEPVAEVHESFDGVSPRRRAPRAPRQWTIVGSALAVGLALGAVATLKLHHPAVSPPAATVAAAAAFPLAPPIPSAPPAVSAESPGVGLASDATAPLASATLSATSAPAKAPLPTKGPRAKAPRPAAPAPAPAPAKGKQDLFGI
jgi:serine/threonine-protein kinase